MSSENQLALNTLSPTSFEGALELSKHMADCGMIPTHLKGKASTCLRIVMFAARTTLDPFSIADKTSDIHGKLMFEGQLVGALINTSGRTKESLNYRFNDYGDDLRKMVVTCFGILKGEAEERSIDLTYEQACKINKNGQMQKMPQQQICYIAARQWARLHMPEVLMGVYADDEFDDKPPADDPKNITNEVDGNASGGATSKEPTAKKAPAKSKGAAGARKAAAASKTAKKAAASVAPEKAEEAKPEPETETEVVEQKPEQSDPLPSITVAIGVTESDVICTVKAVEAKRISGQDGIKAELEGQWQGVCYSIKLNLLSILESAHKNGEQVSLQLEGRESTRDAGVCVVLLVGAEAISEPEDEDAGI